MGGKKEGKGRGKRERKEREREKKEKKTCLKINPERGKSPLASFTPIPTPKNFWQKFTYSATQGGKEGREEREEEEERALREANSEGRRERERRERIFIQYFRTTQVISFVSISCGVA